MGSLCAIQYVVYVYLFAYICVYFHTHTCVHVYTCLHICMNVHALFVLIRFLLIDYIYKLEF
jgi:hypothetical protein